MKQLIDVFFVFYYISDQYITKEMCNSIISENPFSITYVPDQYKTQQTCDKAVDDCLATLKFIPDWFATNKIIKKHFTALCVDENVLYFNEDSINVAFSCNEMGTFNIS